MSATTSAPIPTGTQRKHAKPHQTFRFFDKGIGNRTLAQLTVGTVTQFRDDLRAFGVSVPTTRKIIAMLQVMLAYLIGMDLMAVNPAADVEVHRPPRRGRQADHAARQRE